MKLMIIFGLTLVLSACTVATAFPTPIPSETHIATATQFPSATTSPAPTATPTLTPIPSPAPFAGLSAPRPWLMLEQNDNEPLLIYPPDHHPILLTLPNGGRIRSIQEAVSPD